MLLSLVAAAPARADDPPRPDEISAADAYRESIPTASGPKATGNRGRTARIAPSVALRIREAGGAEAPLLRDVVASPEYGAPPVRRGAEKPAAAAAPDVPSLPAATSEAVGDAFGETRLAVLLLLLAATTSAAIALRLHELRSGAARRRTG